MTEEERKALVEKSGFAIPANVKGLLWVLIGLGVITFVVGLALADKKEELVRVWENLLINVMFWNGVSQGGILLAVIWQLTDAKWGRPFKRIAEAFGAFLPVSFLLFIVSFFGLEVLYEWVTHPFEHHGVQVKAGWLNVHFFVSRNLIWLLVMYAISYYFVVTSLKPDYGFARKVIPGWGGKWGDKLLKGYQNHDTEVVRLEQRSRKIAPTLCLIQCIGMSFLAWDFVMSLDQEWFSTLFGAFSIAGHLYAALGILLAVSVTMRTKFGLEEYITINRLHDLAKLTFACSFLWTYMGFSQFIVIWYADMAEETPFLVIRSMTEPWSTMFVILFFWMSVSVFLLLMPKTFCRNPNFIRVIGVYAALGQWFMNYFLIVPSTQLHHHPNYHIYLGLSELFITLGFMGAFFLCFLSFMSKVPIVPVSDKHLCKSWHGH